MIQASYARWLRDQLLSSCTFLFCPLQKSPLQVRCGGFISCFSWSFWGNVVPVFDAQSADSETEQNHMFYGKENPPGRSSQSSWLISRACMHAMFRGGRGAASFILYASSILRRNTCSWYSLEMWDLKNWFLPTKRGPDLSCLAGSVSWCQIVKWCFHPE